MVWGKCLYVSIGLGHGSLCTCIGSYLFYAQKEWEPHGLMLGWIQLHSRYVSSCLCTSAYFSGDKWYCLGLSDWASGSSKVMSCVTQSEGKKMSSSSMLEKLSNKTEIYGSLAPGAKRVWGPFYSPSSMSLASIARDCLMVITMLTI